MFRQRSALKKAGFREKGGKPGWIEQSKRKKPGILFKIPGFLKFCQQQKAIRQAV